MRCVTFVQNFIQNVIKAQLPFCSKCYCSCAGNALLQGSDGLSSYSCWLMKRPFDFIPSVQGFEELAKKSQSWACLLHLGVRQHVAILKGNKQTAPSILIYLHWWDSTHVTVLPSSLLLIYQQKSSCFWYCHCRERQQSFLLNWQRSSK